jgi:hypothetical protein
MISLILPPKDQISRAAKMLADEYGTASNIKSRVNRLSGAPAAAALSGRSEAQAGRGIEVGDGSVGHVRHDGTNLSPACRGRTGWCDVQTHTASCAS